MNQFDLCPVYKSYQSSLSEYLSDNTPFISYNKNDNIGLIQCDNEGNTKYSHSYRDISLAVEIAESILIERGINKNSKVGMVGIPSDLWVFFFWAIIRLKAIVCPLAKNIPFAEREKTLDSLKADLLVSQDDNWVENKENRLSIISLNSLEKKFRLLLKDKIDKVNNGQIVVAIKKVSLNNLATLVHTSGSTGTPKIIAHSLSNHFFNAWGLLKKINLDIPNIENPRWLLSLPLNHVGGLAILFRTIISKITLVISPNKDLSSTIKKQNITHISLVHTQLSRILQSQSEFSEQISSLKFVLLGGAYVPSILIDKLINKKIYPYYSYGCSEMASTITVKKIDNVGSGFIGVGEALPYRNVKLLKDGEIVLKGNCLFLGYWKDGRISKNIDEDGWYHSKDLATEEKGNIFIIGRKDNMFISGGENIYPESIELKITQISIVNFAIVVPVEDKEFGYRPIAFVHLNNTKLEPKELSKKYKLITEELKNKLPSYSIPIAYYPFPENVLTNNIKVNRFLLKKYVQRAFYDNK